MRFGGNVPYFRRNSVAHTSKTYPNHVWHKDQQCMLTCNFITTREQIQEIPQPAVPDQETGMLGSKPIVSTLAAKHQARSYRGKQLTGFAAVIILKKDFSSAAKLLKRLGTGNASAATIDIGFHNILQSRTYHLDSISQQHRMIRSIPCTC